MALPYALQEGLAGFRRAKFAALASVSALAVALVLLGMSALMGWLLTRAADDLRARAGEIEVFVDALDEAAVARMTERLGGLPGADSVAYVSQEEAARIFREAFGTGADLYDDAAFLPASFRVRFRGPNASADSLARAAERIEAWSRVEEVAYDPDLLDAIERNRTVFQGIGTGVGLLVVLAALLLVGNTIRLSIYARRMLIRTMKLVGATNPFIRRPFLVEGGLQGLAAGAIAAAAVWGLYALLLGQIARADALTVPGWPGGTPLLTALALVALGMLLGLLASWVAVRRFIRSVRITA